MKVRVISAIALVVIVVSTSVGVFIEKLDVNPENQHASTSVVITNIVLDPQILHSKERFSINGTIYNPNTFTINFDTGSISAKFDKNIITIHYPGCSNVVDSRVIRPHQSVEFTLPYGCESYFANSTGTSNAIIELTYVAAGSVHTIMASKNFTINQSLENRTELTLEEQLGLSNTKINPPGETSIFDTGIHPFSINVTNTNFTLHYNISGNNKLLDTHSDVNSKTLILSLKTTSNGTLTIVLPGTLTIVLPGTLTIVLPRTLIDSRIAEQQDDKFFVLMDGQETDYTEIKTTNDTRTLNIHFMQGIAQIEIIGTNAI